MPTDAPKSYTDEFTGASSLALDHYRAINIKQVQNDTLSHFLLTRALTFSLSATGDLTYPSECIESSQIYVSNSQDVSTLPVC
jgi:N-terminal acetyltransferase B complex non-catalytic subunit